MADALLEHLARLEEENKTEKFSYAPIGTMANVYNVEARYKPITRPGWCRLWFAVDGETIVAHASLYSLGTPEEDAEGVVFGTINVERPYRSQGIYGKLQAKRFAFLDKHQLTLAGPVAFGNDSAFHAHRRAGYQYLRQCAETKAVWLYRPPAMLPGNG